MGERIKGTYYIYTFQDDEKCSLLNQYAKGHAYINNHRRGNISIKGDENHQVFIHAQNSNVSLEDSCEAAIRQSGGNSCVVYFIPEKYLSAENDNILLPICFQIDEKDRFSSGIFGNFIAGVYRNKPIVWNKQSQSYIPSNSSQDVNHFAKNEDYSPEVDPIGVLSTEQIAVCERLKQYPLKRVGDLYEYILELNKERIEKYKKTFDVLKDDNLHEKLSNAYKSASEEAERSF